jgi:hypothetical protein
MLEALLIYSLVLWIQYRPFRKNAFSALQGNPQLQSKFERYYSKRRGKYQALSAEAYYGSLAKQAKSALIAFCIGLPVYVLIIIFLYM